MKAELHVHYQVPLEGDPQGHIQLDIDVDDLDAIDLGDRAFLRDMMGKVQDYTVHLLGAAELPLAGGMDALALLRPPYPQLEDPTDEQPERR